MREYLLGLDIGSSSVKACLLDIATGKAVANATSPDTEIPIQALQEGWAEQNPELWWKEVINATRKIAKIMKINLLPVRAIGLSYQEHGLVALDNQGSLVRPAIIWCDSRAVEIGNRALAEIGTKTCFSRYLNSPGNFTASKLAWVKANEPNNYRRISKIMLPGDYIAMKLTGAINTTIPGLSEGILFDYSTQGVAHPLLTYFGFDESILPEIIPTFGDQGRITAEASDDLGLTPGATLTFRAGDQHANAFGLRVLNPGEAAANAGTSGVVLAVWERPIYDVHSRVNTFVHVNHSPEKARYSVVMCVNGMGSLYSWLRRLLTDNKSKPLSYQALNAVSEKISIGSDGVTILPYGNGAERTLNNQNIGASIHGLNFNLHNKGHLLRAGLEGAAFAMANGCEVMNEMGLNITKIRCANSNLFQSSVFSETFATVIGCTIESIATDGAQGAARGAGVGVGCFKDQEEALAMVGTNGIYSPEKRNTASIMDSYQRWKLTLIRELGIEKARF